jgi:hypothetical protein
MKNSSTTRNANAVVGGKNFFFTLDLEMLEKYKK